MLLKSHKPRELTKLAKIFRLSSIGYTWHNAQLTTTGQNFPAFIIQFKEGRFVFFTGWSAKFRFAVSAKNADELFDKFIKYKMIHPRHRPSFDLTVYYFDNEN